MNPSFQDAPNSQIPALQFLERRETVSCLHSLEFKPLKPIPHEHRF